MTDERQRRFEDLQYGNRWLFVVLSILILTLILIVVITSWSAPVPLLDDLRTEAGPGR